MPTPSLSILIPSRHRAQRLAQTLAQLAKLPPTPLAEVIIVDNASAEPLDAPESLANGWPVLVLRSETNLAASARNLAANHASAPWLAMLDDDSHPTSRAFFDVIDEAPDHVFAVGARIRLPNGRHESGGLPEVFVGCGALVRRDPFLELGGYDPAFEYYAEEYDLCARAIAAGFSITHDPRLEILHHKSDDGRDFNRIARLLVRNNAWVIARYTPDDFLRSEFDSMIDRYRAIARRERALGGFGLGVAQWEKTADHQSRHPLSHDHYARFIGLAAVEHHLPAELDHFRIKRAAVVARGKNDYLVDEVLINAGVEIVSSPDDAQALVIGTLSPGPIADALKQFADSAVSAAGAASPSDTAPRAAISIRADASSRAGRSARTSASPLRVISPWPAFIIPTPRRAALSTAV